MIQLDVHPDGVVFGVKAAPGARSSAGTGEHAGLLKVAVTQVAEKGKANQALIAVIAKALDIRKSQIELLSGATQQQKRFLVRGLSRDQLAQRIEELLADRT